MTLTIRLTCFAALLLAWLGYFSPWVWPGPGALGLTAHDLVEWMTFVQTVRDGTHRVTRLDLLWPLAGIALLTALSVLALQPAAGASSAPPLRTRLSRPLHLGALALALFASYLILPGYPFVLTAYRDPELAPQFWMGTAAALTASAAWGFALLRPAWAAWLPPVVSALALAAAVRALSIVRPPIAEMLIGPVPVGYGWVLTVVGLGALAILSSIALGAGLSAARPGA